MIVLIFFCALQIIKANIETSSEKMKQITTTLDKITETVELHRRKSYTTQPIKLYTELSKEELFNISSIDTSLPYPTYEPRHDNRDNHADPEKQPELSPSEMHYTTENSKKNNHDLYGIPEWREKQKESAPRQPYYFESYYERLTSMNYTLKNWTTCEKFLNNSPPLDINKLVNVDWRIFYFWVEDEITSSYNVRFHLPTFTLIDRFRREVHGHHADIKPPVNWTNAELWMETGIDLSAMFIRTETPNTYRFIPTVIFYSDNFVSLDYALKIVEPYLGIVNCKYQTGFSLAPVNKMPSADKALSEASTLGFWNEFGKSVAELEPVKVPVYDENNDDEEDDVDMSIEKDENLMTIF